jgi:hypothetical protein
MGKGCVVTTEQMLENRLEAVENAVAEIKRQLAATPPAPNWLERMAGSFKDEPAFEEVIRLGREFREADRPPEDDPS